MKYILHINVLVSERRKTLTSTQLLVFLSFVCIQAKNIGEFLQKKDTGETCTRYVNIYT